jgi:hypothetical protein
MFVGVRAGSGLCLTIIGFGLLLIASPARAGLWDLDPAKCAQGSAWNEACIHQNGAHDNVAEEPNQWMAVETDSDNPISVQYRMSRTPGDVDCDKAQENNLTIGDKFQVTSKRPHQIFLDFPRQYQPGIALYEWHVCFLINGTVYHAWQGYDPGPGATLKVTCEIDQDRLKTRETDRFLCPDVKLAANPRNFSEYALHCDGKACRRFATREDYDSWHRFNPLTEAVQDQITATVIDYESTHSTYISQNASTFCLSVRGEDPSPALMQALKGTQFQFAPVSQCHDKGGMQVGIGSFTATAADSADGVVGASCGPNCGGTELYTLRKVGNGWKVINYRLGSIN